MVTHKEKMTQKQHNNCPGLVCPICGVTRNTQHNMEIHMEYHDNDEQDTDWSNEEDTQVEEGQVARRDPEEEQEVTGESEETWHQVQRIGSRYKCLTCGVTRNTKNKIDRHMREHEEDIDECIHSINKCDKCLDQSKTGNHVEKHIHERHESYRDSQIYCDMCNKPFRTKRELSHHMSADHKSYKPCDYFKEGKCDVDGECRYNHEILEPGQEICFKCGDKFNSKRDLRRHIEEIHGHEICHRYIQNKCTVRRCLFSHIMPNAPNVDRISQRRVAPVPTQADFHSLPTAGPVVWSQAVAQGPKAPVMSNLSAEAQNKNKTLEAQVLQTLIQMVPQITQQLAAALRTGMTTN